MEENEWRELGDSTREELARSLAAAFLSHQLGVTHATALKRYCSKGVVGEYWLTLAEQIMNDQSDTMNRFITDS